MRLVYETTKGYRLRLGALLLTVLLGTVTGALFPHAIGRIVDEIFYERRMKEFLLTFLAYAGLYLLNQCAHGALNYLWAHLEVTYVVSIRRRCFRHLLRLKAEVRTHIRSGDVMKRIRDDTEMYLEFIHRSLFYVLANGVQLAISIAYLVHADLVLGLTALVMMLPIASVILRQS